MSFPRYPKYKDSGIEFLGEVPAHWELKRLGSVCSFQSGKAHEPFVDDDGEFICVNSRFVSTQGTSEKRCTQNLSPAQIDDVLMVMSDLPNGRALARAFYVSDHRPYAVNQRVCIIRALSVAPRFVFYLLDRNHVFLSHDDGFNQTHLSNDVFTKFPLLVPSPAEQIAIAAFLDAETAKIDELVAEQRRLIELLKEKRQAVISHAVTKGLNPNVPLRPSGIEWLGDVPEHWQVLPLKHLTAIKTGFAFSSDLFTDDGVPVLRIGDITTQGTVDFSNAKYLPDDFADKHVDVLVNRDDIVMAMTGATIGKAARYTSDQPALLNQRVCIFRAANRDSQCFLWFVLQTSYYAEYLAITAFGGAQPNISDTELVAVPVPVPTAKEMPVIVSFLELEIEKLDGLTAEAERAIELLQERRTALISAAVTGKIDVRSFVEREAK